MSVPSTETSLRSVDNSSTFPSLTLTDFDDHILSCIFQRCTTRSLACLSATCRRFRDEIPYAIRMFGLHVHIREGAYCDMMKWTLPYRQYITTLSTRKIPMHMIPWFSLRNLQTLRLSGVRVLVDDVERLLGHLPRLTALTISTIVSTETEDEIVPLRRRYRVLDMGCLPPSLESVVLRFSMPRVSVRALPSWKHLHVHCAGNCIVILEDLGRLESLFVYGSVILTECPQCTTLKRATFDSPEMLLYGHLMDVLPKRMETLSLLLPLSFIIWDFDRHIDTLRIHTRMLYYQSDVHPRQITVFTKVLLASRHMLRGVWQVRTLPSSTSDASTFSDPSDDAYANTFVVQQYVSLGAESS